MMKKLMALLLAVCLLCGCQLASLEENESRMEDKLVGVFVTFDHLDGGFDMEGYLNDNAHAISDGGENVIEPGEAMEYESKFPAAVGENGWVFPGYEGIPMGQMWQGDHWLGFSEEGVCDVRSHSTRTDTLDGIEESGTVYVPMGNEVMFCLNPVYMTPEGEYYAVAGHAFAGTTDGGSMSQSVEEEVVTKEDGEECTYRAKFTVEVKGVELPTRVVFIHMSENHTELKREEYASDALPESIIPADGVAYVITEAYTENGVTRTLHQPGDDPVVIYTATEKAYCLPRFAEILWNE